MKLKEFNTLAEVEGRTWEDSIANAKAAWTIMGICDLLGLPKKAWTWKKVGEEVRKPGFKVGEEVRPVAPGMVDPKPYTPKTVPPETVPPEPEQPEPEQPESKTDEGPDYPILWTKQDGTIFDTELHVPVQPCDDCIYAMQVHKALERDLKVTIPLDAVLNYRQLLDLPEQRACPDYWSEIEGWISATRENADRVYHIFRKWHESQQHGGGEG